MKELEKLVSDYTSELTTLNKKISDLNNSFSVLNPDVDILEQVDLNMLLSLENLLPNLDIADVKLKSLKESINYYKFNLDKQIDLSMLLIKDSKIEKLITDLIFLYNKTLEYKDNLLRKYQEEQKQITTFLEKIQKIINLVRDKNQIDIDNLTNQLLEINLSNEMIFRILKQALEINLSFYKRQLKTAERPVKVDIDANIENVESDIQEDVIEHNKEIYGIKPITDPKDEELKNDLELLISQIINLQEKLSPYLKKDNNLYILFSELNNLLNDEIDLKNDFITTYLAYKELYGELEKEELEKEFWGLKEKYKLLENKYNKLEEEFNLVLKDLEITTTNFSEIVSDLDINNWNFCRYLIFTNATLNDFKKEFSKKNLSLSTVSNILQAFKNMLTIPDLTLLGGQEVKKLDSEINLFEYRITNSSDGGAIRIFFIYYDEKSLFVTKFLFKVSDKQSQEEIAKARKKNIQLLAANYAQDKEQMTRELLEFIISRVKSYQTGEISVVEPNISGNVGEINDVRNNSK